MILDPSALDAWLRLEFVTLVDRLLGLMFSRLKALRKLALISILAFSPITRILGKPNDLAKFRSTSRYLGPGKELRPMPGGGMKAVANCPGRSAIAFA